MVIYTLYADFYKAESFEYRICDDGNPPLCDTGIISIEYKSAIEIPTGISPNGDDYNDQFKIKGNNEDVAIWLIIYNRWGSEIYSNKDYKNDWEGTGKNGMDLPDGTYFYVVKSGDGTSKAGYIVIHR